MSVNNAILLLKKIKGQKMNLLTQHQQKVFDEIISAIEIKSSTILRSTNIEDYLFSLKGAAGTGKTYLTTEIVKYFKSKKDGRLKKSGNIIGFELEGVFWENEPQTAFYDYLYIKTLYTNYRDIIEELTQYDTFTDIEFNPRKSINCQARTCAVLVSLVRLDMLEEVIKSKDKFIEIVYKKKLVQPSLF